VVSDADGANAGAVTEGHFDTNPMWSPDGDLVFARETSFVDARSLTSVFSVDPLGERTRQLASIAGGSIVPSSFSADGTRLLVTIYEGKNGDLYVMDRDGSNMERIVDGPSDDTGGSWRPSV
jgi:TolB protein